MQNTIDATTMQLISGSAINNHRYFDDLTENTFLGHAYLSKTLNKFKITLGYDGQYKDRKFNNTTIGMNFSLSPTVDPNNIDAFINASTILCLHIRHSSQVPDYLILSILYYTEYSVRISKW